MYGYTRISDNLHDNIYFDQGTAIRTEQGETKEDGLKCAKVDKKAAYILQTHSTNLHNN